MVVCVVCGRHPGFLNLSSFNGLYSARLTRAYLGASNGKRLSRFTNRAQRSAAEPMDSDILSYGDYYKKLCAPMHLINVCLNQNIDPAEQLVQRDRKGKPLVIIPPDATLQSDASRTCFAIDGQRGPDLHSARRKEDTLNIGEWIGVSGAAVSTGLGRRSGIALSVALAMASVRLGRWWHSGNQMRSPPGQGLSGWLRRFLPAQAYLFDEMFCRFHGTRRPYHYLSDGGHFENTGVYELLREERNVKLIVACDCGCDSDYEFGDLANLTRLARIDHGREIAVNSKAASHKVLGAVFGTPDQLAGKCGEAGQKCALLLDVFARGCTRDAKPAARIVLLKPRLIDSLSVDLKQYQAQHPAFPQESTADQFFDEAQWESYRKLGLEIARRVFVGPYATAVSNRLYRQTLWQELAKVR